MRRALAILVTGLVAAVSAAAALASNPDFKKGQLPTCTFSTTTTPVDTVSCSDGTVRGLGSEDVAVVLSISGWATFFCVNSSGETVRGQNRMESGLVGSSFAISSAEIRNGSLTLPTLAATLPPPAVTAEQVGCPSGNWGTRVASIAIRGVSVDVIQPAIPPVSTWLRCGALSSGDSVGFGSGETVTLRCATIA